jgi:plastocyanin
LTDLILQTSRSAKAFAASLAATLLMGAVSPAHADPAPAAVTIQNFDYNPLAVTIRVGGQVTWNNLDDEPHAVTSVDSKFRSGALDTGASFTFRFTHAGVYRYVCGIHPQMTASVTVH